MARPLIVIAAFLCLAVPAALAAPPANKGKNRPEQSATTQAAQDNAAAKTCKAERGTTPASLAAFKSRYGTNDNKANAFGKCVSKLAKAQND